VIPARCERSRQSISLRLDGQLSMFEGALLDRHLRGCSSCRAFAQGLTAQTSLLRGALLEQLESPVDVPEGRRRPVRAAAVTVLGAFAAAAAAITLVGGHNPAPGSRTSQSLSAGPRRVLVDVAAQPGADGLVPRTTHASEVDPDAVRGVFSLPV
jgi:anti-sigma factor RsiW